MRRAQTQPPLVDEERERAGLAFKNHIARLLVFSFFFLFILSIMSIFLFDV